MEGKRGYGYLSTSAGQRTVRTPKLSMFVLNFGVERCGGHR